RRATPVHVLLPVPGPAAGLVHLDPAALVRVLDRAVPGRLVPGRTVPGRFVLEVFVLGLPVLGPSVPARIALDRVALDPAALVVAARLPAAPGSALTVLAPSAYLHSRSRSDGQPERLRSAVEAAGSRVD